MKCIRMLTFLPLEQIDEMSTWKDQRLNEAKEILAYELTSMVHGKEEAERHRQQPVHCLAVLQWTRSTCPAPS